MNPLLLQICCGPCLPHVLQSLKDRYTVTGFFYNPNIQPEEEYRFREKELQLLEAKLNLRIIYGEYHPEVWLQAIQGMESEPERGARCSLCFGMRLHRTFAYARENHFSAVASTLSISPHKDTRQINTEGEKAALEFGIDFLPENFKKGNGALYGRKLADELGVKRQNYCGCLYSRRP